MCVIKRCFFFFTHLHLAYILKTAVALLRVSSFRFWNSFAPTVFVRLVSHSPNVGCHLLGDSVDFSCASIHARSNRFLPIRRESRQNSSRKKEGLLRMKSVLNSALISVYRKINLHRSGQKASKTF